MAEADASLAHVEHRLMNFYSAEKGAQDALAAFSSLRTPKGQAACARLLAMVALDTDNLSVAESQVERATELYTHLGDPWGIFEASLIHCQVCLARHDLATAHAILDRLSRDPLDELKPRQHLLLTRAWYEMARGRVEQAVEAVDAAAAPFETRSLAGDHTPHLLMRLARYAWPAEVQERLDHWRAQLLERARRKPS
jgi:hypothetical protein